jgi:hypothetical protein
LAAVGALGKVVRGRAGGGGKKAGAAPAAATARAPAKALAGAVAALHLEEEDEEVVPGPPAAGSASEGDGDGGGGGGEEGGGPDSPYAVLDTLTASPRPGDTLLQAIPMVAPYAALAGAALRVKLSPGTGKRGKVAKAAAALLARAGAGVTPRMRELMRAVPDVEAAAVVPGGGAKVVAPGAARLAAEARAGKKKKKEGG